MAKTTKTVKLEKLWIPVQSSKWKIPCIQVNIKIFHCLLHAYEMTVFMHAIFSLESIDNIESCVHEKEKEKRIQQRISWCLNKTLACNNDQIVSVPTMAKLKYESHANAGIRAELWITKYCFKLYSERDVSIIKFLFREEMENGDRKKSRKSGEYNMNFYEINELLDCLVVVINPCDKYFKIWCIT